jgi:hypothetical protein
MDILVDFNNVLETDRRRGIVFVSEKILNAIGPARLGVGNRVSFRLYDGWYELQSLTPKAQLISADVLANSPRTVDAPKRKTHKNVDRERRNGVQPSE